MLEVQFFGRLRELAEASGASIAVDRSQTSLDELIDQISEQDETLANAVSQKGVRCIVDGAFVVGGQIDLERASEIAFIPPVSGG